MKSRVRNLLCALVAAAFAASPALAREYDLVIGPAAVETAGERVPVLAINGQVPGPTLTFTEGEEAVIRVRNALDEPTSLHWHGLLVPGLMDGVPGLNGFPGIAPGETFTYRFTLRQSGTYWYHSHSGGQEQQGVYGPLIIAPAKPEAVTAARDYVVMLSDLTAETPRRILGNLKMDAGYYNRGHRTMLDFFRDVGRDGADAALRDRLDWGEMRMDPTDLADVSGYTFLVNGKDAAANETFLFTPGERMRLRFINGSAMSYFDVRIPDLRMIVVAADGRPVQPVPVDEFRIAVAETYDVIVSPKDDKPYTIFAEPIDRSGYARATLATREGLEGPIPATRPRTRLTMDDMGMAHGGHGGHDGHDMPGMDMTGMDMSGMDHSAHAMPEATDDGAGDGASDNAPPRGWAAGAPGDARVLDYRDLKSVTPNDDPRAPEREIVVRLGGSMDRYLWTINGESTDTAKPIGLSYGERVRLTFINEAMMAHPMHLHGMFVELENGQETNRPEKHIVSVPPGKSYSVLLTADEPGEWAFHCHLLYHMMSGMMTKVVVARLDAEARP